MSDEDEFNPLTFEKRLTGLKDTQDAIQGMSSWCLKQREHHKKIVSSWLNVLKRVKVEQRLVLFYLANDVIQYSKRKNYQFVESWGLNLQKATPLVRDEKVKHKILRIFKIWEQRSVYDEEFLSDLTGLLSVKKPTDDDTTDFQPQQLVNKVKQCSVLEADTDLRLKYIHESHLELSDADALCANLKERRNTDDVEKELAEGIECVERYTAALQREIVAREALLALLGSAHQYYASQRGEVKVVAYAYKNFGARVRCLKRKLDELVEKLPSARERTPSPPRPGEEVPSPGPDEDLDLPTDDIAYNIDKTFSTSISVESGLYNPGFSSFLGGENPFNNLFHENSDNSGSKIEVINSRPTADKPEFNINDFLKTLTSEQQDNSNNSAPSSGVLSSLKNSDTLPGMDLLTPESTGNAPTLSFYGSLENSVQDEPEQQYQSDPQWSNTPTSWNVPSLVPAPRPVAAPVIPVTVPVVTTMASRPYVDTPESPPHSILQAPPTIPVVVPEGRLYTQDMPTLDVDHRGLLPPPPPPPMMPILGSQYTHSTGGELEDVDHRLLPAISQPLAAPPTTRHQTGQKDVDHRNLISLTAPRAPPQRHIPGGMDQDYRVPPPLPPTDIVESVDMDLSDDEQQNSTQQGDMMYSNTKHSRYNQHSSSFADEGRSRNFNQNNKVLVGGDNGTQNHKPVPKDNKERHNLIRINSVPNDSDNLFENMEKIHEPHSAPVPKLTDPFENMNNRNRSLPFINTPFNEERKIMDIDFDNIDEAMALMEQDTDNVDEDMRTRFPDNLEVRNPSPPQVDFAEDEWIRNESEWSNPPNQNRNQMNPRFQRNWTPRPQHNFRPQGFMQQQQFWSRNGPRPPPRPWMGQRPRGGFW